MKLALGMMVHDDAPWLRLHLPVIADCFDGIVIVQDNPPEDTRRELANLSIMRSNGFIFEHRFDDNWSAMLNHLIHDAETLGFDAMLRLDPDELMFPGDTQALRDWLTIHKLICFPRYNFWMDRQRYAPSLFPDYQARAWRLKQGVKYIGKRHEGIAWHTLGWSEENGEVYRAKGMPIFHYGDISLQNILKRDLKYLNMARVDAGYEPLAERPADRPTPHRDNILFEGRQPLDPAEVGIYAPFTE